MDPATDDDDLSAAILDVIGTFRPEAKILLDDIRFAAAVDGCKISVLSSEQIVQIIRQRCIPSGETDQNRRTYWVRKW